jgi:hypothetical protein
MQAMDRIEAILIPPRHKAKRLPDRTNEYESGGGKVIIRVGRYGFDDVVGFGLDQIRRSAFTSGQVAVLDCFLEVVYFTMRANVAPDRRRSLWERALAVGRLTPQEITDPRDAANLVLRAIEVGAPLLSTPLGEKVGEDLHELARFSGDLPGGERIQRGSRSRCGREASGDHPAHSQAYFRDVSSGEYGVVKVGTRPCEEKTRREVDNAL